MVQIQIHVQGVRETVAHLNKIQKEIPNEIRQGVNVWGRRLRNKYKNHVASNHHFTGQTEKSLKWRDLTKNGNYGYISMRLEGIYLSEAKPHFVRVSYKLRRWVNQKLPGFQGRYIRVRGHPFISRIYMQHYPKLAEELSRRLKRGMKK